ncbi:MAG: HAD family hydrolase [Candidatus Calescibacterium sp.]|nr:HAD family hydrolase [Candidatus Calescibacterium sp.]
MPTLFFDLDGTLLDTSEDIFFSLNSTLKKFKIGEIDFQTTLSYIGNGVKPLIEKTLNQLGRTEELEKVLKDFLSNYRKNIAKKTYIYQGNIELIFTLKKSKWDIILLTNKSQHLTSILLSQLGITQIFDLIVCGDTFDAKKPNPKLFEIIKNIFPIKEPLFVLGDGINDLIFASNIGANFILAEWGFLTESSEKEIKSLIDKKIIRTKTPYDVIEKLKNAGVIKK